MGINEDWPLSARRWPRTFRGWRKLFWLALGVCPAHWAMLRTDSPWELNAFCFKCDGIGIWPNGLRAALIKNAWAEFEKDRSEIKSVEAR